MKSTNISSATGRSPEAAAPAAAPMYADSLIGVSRTRSGKRGYRPLVTPSTPPHASSSPGASMPPATSSPITTTVGSRSISRASASLMACWYVMFRAIVAPLVGHVDVGLDLGGRRVGPVLGLRDGLVDEPADVLVDALEVLGVEDPGVGDALHERREAVAGAPDLLHLAGAAVGLLVALEVAVVAQRLALQQRRAAARAGARDRLARRLVHGEEVEAVHDDAREAEAVGALGHVDAALVIR